MGDPYQAVKVTDRVYWVGAIDWNLREFHGYATPRGTTYNAFLVMADKVTLIDTVKAAFCDEMLSRIASVVDPSKIDYVVSNHAEMDHTGSLPRVIATVKPERIFASAAGVKALGAHFHLGDAVTSVKNGETLSLGNLTLTFIETRMLHWPDSMFSFLSEEGVLFSQDGFGMHLATGERFADELDKSLLAYEAAKYYANIILPYSHLVTQLLGRLGGILGNVKMIAPDHGPIWRKDIRWIVDLYGKWAEQKPSKKAVIVYDTMWNSTDKMARAIAEGLIAEGVATKLMCMSHCRRSDVVTELLGAGALVVGSPTMNNNIFPTMADVMTYLKGLRPKNLIGAAFGSYGWGGEAVADLNDLLAEMKIDVIHEGIKCIYVPTHDTLHACRDLGRRIAEKLAGVCATS